MKNKLHSILLSTVLAFLTISPTEVLAQCVGDEANIYSFDYNGKTYEIVKENKTWVEAAACAVARGGYLVVIDDAAENTKVFTEATTNAGITNASTTAGDGGGGAYLWLGGNDIATEGNWIWDGDNDGTGTQFWSGYGVADMRGGGSSVGGAYTHWGASGAEPDDFPSGFGAPPHQQNGLALNLDDWPNGNAGEWNDVSETMNMLYYIIEKEPSTCTNTSSTFDASACDSYTWIDGNTYTASNSTATHTLMNVAGCDSVVTLNLTINESTTSIDVQSACDSYTWIDGNTYTASNSTATHTSMNAAGCDNVATLNLTINESTTSIDVQSACDSYTWIDGNTYTASNSTATHTSMNAAGCDNVATLNLTINESTTSIDVQSACDSYTWIDGNTYTASNSTATHTSMNAAGCDNVATLNLTINESTTSIDVQSACDSYTWIDGNTYTASNSTATHTSMNAAGCDNVATLNLTINESTTSIDVQSACDSYTWIDGNTYTASNSTATHTSMNAAGCDNVATLNLTINESTTSIDVQSACDSYTWIDGNTYTASNSTATYTSMNAAGCDSVVTLNLTINESTTSIDVQSACDSYTWTDGNTYTASNSTATQTLTNIAGCDSVVTLNLTITTVEIGTSVASSVISSNAINATYRWLDCDDSQAVIAGETSMTFTPTATGNFSVEVTQNGCIDTSLCVNIPITTLGIDDLYFKDVSIYPNPSTGTTAIHLGNLKDVGITIYDFSGKELMSRDKINDPTYYLEEKGKAGIYFVKIQLEGKERILKWVRQ